MTSQKSTAILIEGCSDVTLTDNKISNYDNGIVARKVTRLVAERNEVVGRAEAALQSLRRHLGIPAAIADAELVSLLEKLRTSPQGEKETVARSSRIARWLEEYGAGFNAAIQLLERVARLF